MQAYNLRGARPTVARRATRPATKVQALPSYYNKVKKEGHSVDKVFVGQPFVSKQPQPTGLAPLPTRAAAGGAGGKDEEKLYFGSPVSTWQKIVPLGLMFFCILFNYTILRDTKDVLVVTAPGSGAEIIPFLKTWVNLPLAIVFTVGYAQAANHFTLEQLFYGFIIPFIAFFGAFAFFIYPNTEMLHPTEWSKDLLAKWGERWMGPLAIVRNWTFCLFYVMAELWGSVVVSVLFWGFANTITTVDEAKKFYPLFGLGANVALIFSGQAVRYFSDVRSTLPAGVDGWAYSLRGMMSLVVGFGLAICALRRYLQKTTVEKHGVLRDKKEKKKENMSVGESFVFLAKSSYIRSMAILVIAYGISINLVEVTWKGKLKAQYPDPNDYSTFMGNFSTCTGAVTFLLMILSRWIFSRFGWGTAAVITPLVLGATGIMFFSLILFSSTFDPMLAGLGLTPLFAAVMVGAAQNVFSKGAKYSLFDPCKEMAYIPLDDEVKTKGKAAIDVICNPLGKSGGALIQQFMIIGFGSLAASTPYLGVILLGIILLWLQAATALASEFSALNAQREAEAIRESGAEPA